jgi:SAM-dependent methyltransferase
MCRVMMTTVMKTKHWGPMVATEPCDVINCASCGFMHQNPLPDARTVERSYGNDELYTQEHLSAWFLKERLEHKAHLHDAEYTYQTSLLNRTLSLLDIGSSVGHYVQWWKEHVGTEAWGIEPSMAAHKHAATDTDDLFRYLSTWEIYHKDMSYPLRKSINVRMSLVLEHVSDPLALLRQYAHYLGHEGALLITVPNETNPLQVRLQRRIGYAWWVDMHHINYFSRYGMRNLLKDAGLYIVHESATFPMEAFALLGRNYIGHSEIGTRCHQDRLRFEQVLGTRAYSLYHLLYKLFGVGRELLVTAKRA